VIDVYRRNGKVYAVVPTGEVLPVTDMIDINGDDCDFEDAVVVVAGPDKEKMWYTIELNSSLESMH